MVQVQLQRPLFVRLLPTILLCQWLALSAFDSVACSSELQPKLISVAKIWSGAPHNAFTDLVRWRGSFYCAFREGEGHAGDRGKLRIIASRMGEDWQSVAVLEMQEYDLRDAALSITPDDRLMVLGGAQRTANGTRRTGTFVSFSEDAKAFTEPKLVMSEGRWLWRVTWHQDTAYGIAYGAPDDREQSSLHSTKDGVNFDTVSKKHLSVGGWPTEARLRFDDEGNCYSLHRRDGSETTAFLGRASPPYDQWDWKDLGIRFGGPNFIKLPNGQWVGAGRLYDGGARTEIVSLDLEQGKLQPILRLPSGGDTSYPGMVWHDNVLWVSYYSSHEGRTSIYLAKVRFPSISEPIELGNRLELFVDEHLVESQSGTELRLHHPRPEEVVLKFDRVWEGQFSGYITVMRDDKNFKMYYRGLPKAGGDGSANEVTCLAESDDGVHWKKPDLELYPVAGASKNNVVLKNQTPASHNFSPFFDRRKGVSPEERYKALGGTSAGLIAFSSPDGVRWNRMQEKPVFTEGVFDSQNVSFYSEEEKQYVCYFRTWTGKGYRGYRTISRTTSKDFIHWAKPEPMTFGDTPNEHLYVNQTTPYFRAPHIYLAVAARFMPGRQVLSSEEALEIGVNPKYFGDISDAVLLSSRGGNVYSRRFMQSFIRPGLGIQNWVSRTNYPALGIVQTSDTELSIYVQKNYGQPTVHLRRYSMRLDGFASLHAGYQPGEVTTKVLRFAGARNNNQVGLYLNAATSAAGAIRVEVQDSAGNAIPGYSLDDCQEMIGDRISHRVKWRGSPNLDALVGQPVRLRFEAKDADIYSLQFK